MRMFAITGFYHRSLFTTAPSRLPTRRAVHIRLLGAPRGAALSMIRWARFHRLLVSRCRQGGRRYYTNRAARLFWSLAGLVRCHLQAHFAADLSRAEDLLIYPELPASWISSPTWSLQKSSGSGVFRCWVCVTLGFGFQPGHQRLANADTAVSSTITVAVYHAPTPSIPCPRIRPPALWDRRTPSLAILSWLALITLKPGVAQQPPPVLPLLRQGSTGTNSTSRSTCWRTDTGFFGNDPDPDPYPPPSAKARQTL